MASIRDEWKTDLISTVTCLVWIENSWKLSCERKNRPVSPSQASSLYYLVLCSSAFSTNSSPFILNTESKISLNNFLCITDPLKLMLRYICLPWVFSATEIPFMFPISAVYDPGTFQTNPTAFCKTFSLTGNFAIKVHPLPNIRCILDMVLIPERVFWVYYTFCPHVFLYITSRLCSSKLAAVWDRLSTRYLCNHKPPLYPGSICKPNCCSK